MKFGELKVHTACLISIVAFSCISNPNIPSEEENISTIKKLTGSWISILNKRNFDSLNNIYAKTIIVNGDTLSRKIAIQNKKNYLMENVEFSQTISGTLQVNKLNDSLYTVSFPVTSMLKKEKTEVVVQLIFKRINLKWQIISEIDNSMERLALKNEKSPVKANESKPCDNLITEILKTSSRYKRLTRGLNKSVQKNGGERYDISLEGSPFPKNDKTIYSKTYDFTVFENYPDRRVNIARFSFSPIDKQLYEYDVANDRLNPIEFDRSLLSSYNDSCK